MARSPRKLEERKLKRIMQEDWPFLYNEQRRQEFGYLKTDQKLELENKDDREND